MRHQIAGKKLSRAVKPRQALFRSLVTSLVNHGKLETSLAKAKAIRPLVDKLITKAKKASLITHHQVQAFLQNQEFTQKLIRDLAPAFTRKSGFVKITRLPVKRSDAAPMARIEWSDKITPPAKKVEAKPVKTTIKVTKKTIKSKTKKLTKIKGA